MPSEPNKILIAESPYRRRQIENAWFDLNVSGYGQITTLPKNLREKLKDAPWLTVKPKVVLRSKTDGTRKALLELEDGNLIESVLMCRENKKQNPEKGKRYTICVSTQVGCPMKCSFCATGQIGFKCNLTAEEIIDQYRFWQRYLAENSLKKIANMVLMGQGEPLLNYDNVKRALNIILNNTDIGPRKITISTVGVMPAMKKMLADKNFPPVRFSLSLHSAVENTRAKIIPSHQSGFLEFLIGWAKKYHQVFPSRTHFIGLEYTLLKGINDTVTELKALKKLASQLGRVRINLIPYNCPATNNNFISSPLSVAERWRDTLIKAGFVATIRRSQGQDISAACGQLQNNIT